MADLDVDALRAKATLQGSKVRQMKKDGAPQEEITAAVEELKMLKVQLVKATKDDEASSFEKNRSHMDDLLKQRMFVVPSFEIYGGVAGFYDFGPPACALKSNFINEWKKHFILHDNMLEIECTNINASIVLETSGHVERFTDLMVKDPKNGECFRADHLLEGAIDLLIEKEGANMTQQQIDEHLIIQRQADAFSPEEIDDLIVKYKILSPSSGSELSKSFPFNLMFKTTIGPEGTSVGYLRPETAQGIFLNFKRLLEYNAGKMPFAGAQVGTGFRNEIAPRCGLLRVREFTMAEIEHFVNPNDKSHERFSDVKDVVLTLFPSKNQLSDGKLVKMTAGDAVKNGLIANETLAYFLCRTQLFAIRVGLLENCIRFRQHLPTEMAHYASDCWDLELKGSYGWTECAGHADRACYDLEVHAKKSKVDMVASERYPEPRDIEVTIVKPNRKELGIVFKKQQKDVLAHLEALPVAEAMELEGKLDTDGEVDVEFEGAPIKLTRSMVKFSSKKKRVTEGKFTPSVIEPSFGVGRWMYHVFEHAFYLRENDEKRRVMAFSPVIAPIKCAVLPLSANKEFESTVDGLTTDLIAAGLSTKVDKSNTSIGRRYARMDELGVPFIVTVDFDTIGQATRPVTMRERDSTAQVTLPLADVVQLVNGMTNGSLSWAKVTTKYPVKVEEGAVRDGPTTQQNTGRGLFTRPADGSLSSGVDQTFKDRAAGMPSKGGTAAPTSTGTKSAKTAGGGGGGGGTGSKSKIGGVRLAGVGKAGQKLPPPAFMDSTRFHLVSTGAFSVVEIGPNGGVVAAAAPAAPAASASAPAPAPAPAAAAGGAAGAAAEIVAAITAQGNVVKELKTAGGDIKEAVTKLLELKAQYKEVTGEAFKSPNEGSKKKKKKAK